MLFPAVVGPVPLGERVRDRPQELPLRVVTDGLGAVARLVGDRDDLGDCHGETIRMNRGHATGGATVTALGLADSADSGGGCEVCSRRSPCSTRFRGLCLTIGADADRRPHGNTNSWRLDPGDRPYATPSALVRLAECPVSDSLSRRNPLEFRVSADVLIVRRSPSVVASATRCLQGKLELASGALAHLYIRIKGAMHESCTQGQVLSEPACRPWRVADRRGCRLPRPRVRRRRDSRVGLGHPGRRQRRGGPVDRRLQEGERAPREVPARRGRPRRPADRVTKSARTGTATSRSARTSTRS